MIISSSIHVAADVTKLGSACTWAVKPSGEGKRSLQGQARSPGQLVLKIPKLPEGFQGKGFKDRMREGRRGVCDQLLDILLIGWW